MLDLISKFSEKFVKTLQYEQTSQVNFRHRAIGRSQNRRGGDNYQCGGHNLPPSDDIGLTDMTKSWGRAIPPPPFPTVLRPTRRNWDSVYMKFLRVLANMRPLTAPIILTFIPIATSLLLLLSSSSVKANDLENCCDKVYLYSSDAIADTHPFFLGIYKYGGQHKNRPYFYKKEKFRDYTQQIVENKFFLVFAENGKAI